MGRQRYEYYHQRDCRGGINEEPENARSNQVLDARNVWCPNGILEQRPGYKGLPPHPIFVQSGGSFGSQVHVFYDGSAGTFGTVRTAGTAFNDHENAEGRRLGEVGDTWYVGFPAVMILGFRTEVDNNAEGNTNDVYAECEYYNGTDWLPLTVHELEYADGAPVGGTNRTDVNLRASTAHHKILYSAHAQVYYYFTPPTDWATTTVNGSAAKYFLRFHIVARGDNTMDGSVTVSNTNLSVDKRVTDTVYAKDLSRALIVPQFSSSTRFIFMKGLSIYASGFQLANADSIRYNSSLWVALTTRMVSYLNLPSYAVIPQFDEVYVAFCGEVFVFSADPRMDGSEPIDASVEDRPEYVGTVFGIKSKYHPDYVAQLSGFPKAKYLEFFDGQLWAANIGGQPFTIRWSVTHPYYRVWPAVSYDILMEDDNSPITGLKALQESLVVFKQDSIWIMQFVKEGPIANEYVARKVVSGIGCVSNSSITEINGKLIFLAEDGIYSFDGVQVQKLSSAIDKTVAKINPGRRHFADGVHWREKSCYLLSVALGDGGENDTMLVWDYKHNAWWIWDNFNAVSLAVVEGEYDRQEVYFLDTNGSLYQLNAGTGTDHGTAITSYVQTHRLGLGDFRTKTAREVRVNMHPKIVGNVGIEVTPDDRDSGTSKNLSLVDSNEAKYGTAVYGTDTYASNSKYRERRMPFRETGEHFKVKVTNSNKNQKLVLNRISLGVTQKEAR
jgi:hypothetical protein